MTNAIVIEGAAIEPIPVTLVGKDYVLTPPKAGVAMRIAGQAKRLLDDDPMQMITLVDEWAEKAFGKAEFKKVKARLEDPKDALDVQHIMSLMQAVIERQAGENPTS